MDGEKIDALDGERGFHRNPQALDRGSVSFIADIVGFGRAGWHLLSPSRREVSADIRVFDSPEEDAVQEKA